MRNIDDEDHAYGEKQNQLLRTNITKSALSHVSEAKARLNKYYNSGLDIAYSNRNSEATLKSHLRDLGLQIKRNNRENNWNDSQTLDTNSRFRNAPDPLIKFDTYKSKTPSIFENIQISDSK